MTGLWKKVVPFILLMGIIVLCHDRPAGAAVSDYDVTAGVPPQEASLPDAPVAGTASYSTKASLIIPMDRTRTKASIVQMAKELPHSGFNGGKHTAYDTPPRWTAPYEAGSLSMADISDALNALKMVRYIAGLPYQEVAFTPDLNSISQHGAVLLAALDQMTHYPMKPADMPDAFFDIAYRGCSEANLYAGPTNIASTIIGFVADSGANNIERAGHRRWLLKPGGQNFGIGHARNNYGGYGSYTSLYVFDGPGPFNCEADTYVAWPNGGDFPIQYFLDSENLYTKPVYPWSINLGAMYQAPSRDELTLTLTRERDGRVWRFDASTPQLGMGYMPEGEMHLAVDDSGYGMRKAIIFRPDVTTLGTIVDGDIFTVNLSGIKTDAGAPTTLDYTIRFFDLQKAMNKDTAEAIAFTDMAFKQAVVDALKYLPGYDGYTTSSDIFPYDAQKVTHLDVSGKGVQNLEGLAYFTKLETLNCSHIPLTSLDVSNHPALTELLCWGNQLTRLDVSRNPALTTLFCGENQLTDLDVSHNTALIELNCSGNQLTNLDLSANTALDALACRDNPLRTIRMARVRTSQVSIAADGPGTVAIDYDSLWGPFYVLATPDDEALAPAVFTGWTRDDEIVSLNPRYDLSPGTDYDLVAHFYISGTGEDVEPPVITGQTADASITVGEAVTLNVTAAVGVGTLSYQWYEGHTAIPGATTATYTVAAGTAGVYTYHVVVTNTLVGSDGTTKTASVTGDVITVTVHAAADVQKPIAGLLPYLRKPYDGTPIEGLFLEAYSPDGGTLSFDWFWGSMDTAGVWGYLGYSADGRMPAPGPTEPGMYKIEAVVINHKDGVASEPVRVSSLIWIVSEPVITLPVKEIHVAEGEPIILDAQVTTADGGTLFYWWHQADASDIAGTFRRMDELAVDGYTGNGGQSAYLVDDTHPAPGVYVYQLLVFNVRVLWPDGDGVIGNGYDVNGTWFYGGTWATESVWVYVE